MYEGLHYNSIASYLKKEFGQRVIKLSLDAGLTCPNRDGSKGFGGCSFCSQSGSGDFASNIDDQIKLLSQKWGSNNKYIAYFQNHTNTYSSASNLRRIWDEALSHENVIGLAIATRPDCLGEDILDLLDEFNKKTFLWVELGLQTSNEDTALAFNRCYKNSDFEDAMSQLSRLGIKTVIHLILGLPGENKEQMIDSAKYVRSFMPFGIKLHSLHLLDDSKMGHDYLTNPWTLMSKKEYVETVVDILELLPQNITIHRLTGDGSKDHLIGPNWAVNKHDVLNEIQQEFKRRGSYQGYFC